MEKIEDEQCYNESNNWCEQEVITRACSLVERNEEPGAQIPENIKGLKPWTNADSSIMHDLRHHDEILSNYHPHIKGEEIGEGQIHEQPHIYIRLNVQNFM